MEDVLEKVKVEIERVLMYEPKLIKETEESRKFRDIRIQTCRNILFLIDNMPVNKVWHDEKEEPEDKSKAVVCQIGDKSQTVFTFEYNKSDRNFHYTGPLGCEYLVGLDWPGIRWAYPEDLLPTK